MAHLMNEIKELELKRLARKQEAEEYRCAVVTCKENDSKLRTEEETILRQCGLLRLQITSLQQAQANRILLFGSWMREVVEMIEDYWKRGMFHLRPRGPLGMYLHLVDSQWSLAVESCLKSLLHAFTVNDYHDERKMAEIFQKTCPQGKRPTVIISSFTPKVYDVPRVQSDQYKTVLDMLQITDPVVANALIDQRGIESVLLVPGKKEMMRIMKYSPPPNINEAFSLAGDQAYTRPFRYYSNLNRKRANILTVNREETIRRWQQQLTHEQGRHAKLLKDQQEVKTLIKRNEKEEQNCRTQVVKLRMELSDLKCKTLVDMISVGICDITHSIKNALASRLKMMRTREQYLAIIKKNGAKEKKTALEKEWTNLGNSLENYEQNERLLQRTSDRLNRKTEELNQREKLHFQRAPQIRKQARRRAKLHREIDELCSQITECSFRPLMMQSSEKYLAIIEKNEAEKKKTALVKEWTNLGSSLENYQQNERLLKCTADRLDRETEELNKRKDLHFRRAPQIRTQARQRAKLHREINELCSQITDCENELKENRAKLHSIDVDDVLETLGYQRPRGKLTLSTVVYWKYVEKSVSSCLQYYPVGMFKFEVANFDFSKFDLSKARHSLNNRSVPDFANNSYDLPALSPARGMKTITLKRPAAVGQTSESPPTKKFRTDKTERSPLVSLDSNLAESISRLKGLVGKTTSAYEAPLEFFFSKGDDSSDIEYIDDFENNFLDESCSSDFSIVVSSDSDSESNFFTPLSDAMRCNTFTKEDSPSSESTDSSYHCENNFPPNRSPYGRLTRAQYEVLRIAYSDTQLPTYSELSALAQKLQITVARVQTYFKRKRYSHRFLIAERNGFTQEERERETKRDPWKESLMDIGLDAVTHYLHDTQL